MKTEEYELIQRIRSKGDNVRCAFAFAEVDIVGDILIGEEFIEDGVFAIGDFEDGLIDDFGSDVFVSDCSLCKTVKDIDFSDDL